TLPWGPMPGPPPTCRRCLRDALPILAAGAGPVPAGHLRRGCRRGPVRAGHLRRGRRCPRCGWFAPVTTPGKPTVGQGWSMTDADIAPEAALARFVEGLGLVITATGTRGEYVVGETPDELASAGIRVCLDDELLVEYLRRLDETPDATAGLSPLAMVEIHLEEALLVDSVENPTEAVGVRRADNGRVEWFWQ